MQGLSGPCRELACYSFVFLIEVQLSYNIVCVSGVQQSDTLLPIYTCIKICIYVYILFSILFHYGLLKNIEYSSLHYRVSPLHMNLQVASFERCQSRSGSSKDLELMPSMPSVNETALCPLASIAEGPSAPPSLTSSPSSSQQLFLPVC